MARTLPGLGTAAIGALAFGFAYYQAPCMRDQIWFFGRACRNIRDQHITAGKRLAAMTPKPKRVMVGDAGAIMYASDLPGLDLIGLGGFHDLPFARASVHGLGATLELLERIPRSQWPDAMAIYPSWWGDLPAWFGREAFEVPVRGNVICGGAEKVVYRTDWHALGTGAQPRARQPKERVVDELDVADLVSEREHRYEFSHPGAGFVDMKILPDPVNPSAPLFDAGRRIPEHRPEHFRMRAAPDLPARLLLRTAPEHDGVLEVRVDGRAIGRLPMSASTSWIELGAELPPTGRSSFDLDLELITGGDWVNYHVWIVQSP
jgi:hypothetical protein